MANHRDDEPARAATAGTGETHDELGVCVLHPPRADPEPPSAKWALPPPIGGRLREVRRRRRLTLSDVERLSGISKSMLSQIERGRVNPSFATLWNLTRALEVQIGELLFEVSNPGGDSRAYEHLTVDATPVIGSGDGRSLTRVLSPRRYPFPVEWYEMVLEPGGARRAGAHGNGVWEHMTCIVGEVVLEIGGQEVPLKPGETVRYSGNQPHGARNEGTVPAHLLLVLVPYPQFDSFAVDERAFRT